MGDVSRFDFALTRNPEDIRQALNVDSSALADRFSGDILGELNLNATTLLGLDAENRRKMDQSASNSRVTRTTFTNWDARLDTQDTFTEQGGELIEALNVAGSPLDPPPPPAAAIPRPPGGRGLLKTQPNPAESGVNPTWVFGFLGLAAVVSLIV
jgi:hypothetical protein